MHLKVLGISGTLVGSKTVALVGALLNQLQHNLSDVQVELIDLKDYDMNFCDGRFVSDYNQDTQTIIRKIQEADAFIIGTTIIHGSIPGALKNLFDVVPTAAFENKCVMFTANGGNPLHYLAVENYLKPIANYLKMFVLPQYVFALSGDFEKDNTLKKDKIAETNRVIESYVSYVWKLV